MKKEKNNVQHKEEDLSVWFLFSISIRFVFDRSLFDLLYLIVVQFRRLDYDYDWFDEDDLSSIVDFICR